MNKRIILCDISFFFSLQIERMEMIMVCILIWIHKSAALFDRFMGFWLESSFVQLIVVLFFKPSLTQIKSIMSSKSTCHTHIHILNAFKKNRYVIHPESNLFFIGHWWQQMIMGFGKMKLDSIKKKVDHIKCEHWTCITHWNNSKMVIIW